MVGKNLEKYYWFLGILAASIIFTIVLIFFAITPSVKGIKKVEGEIKEKKAELSVLEEKLVKLKELKTREKELKEKEAIVNKAIPTKKEIGELFIQLEGIINETGGSNDGISEGQGSSSSASAQGTDQETVSGVANTSYGYSVTFPDYKNYKKFLERSENALRFISLNNFNVNSSNTSFDVSLSYKTYYRNKAETEVVPGEAP